MDRPTYVDGSQRQALLMASRSTRVPVEFQYREDTLTLEIPIPPQAVAAVHLKFAPVDVLQQTAERTSAVGATVHQRGRALALASEEKLLTELQRVAFGYLDAHWNPANGLVADRNSENVPASVLAVGMALTAYPVAVERGFLSRDEALKRTRTTLRFFWNSSQGPVPNATGYKSFCYHFLDMKSGQRTVESELSSIDSGCLLAGILCAAAYFDRETEAEREVRLLADALLRRVDWPWMQDKGPTLTHGWAPDKGFLDGRWLGDSEALFLYLLGLGAEQYPLRLHRPRCALWAG